jgi:hypothetical protein
MGQSLPGFETSLSKGRQRIEMCRQRVHVALLHECTFSMQVHDGLLRGPRGVLRVHLSPGIYSVYIQCTVRLIP